MMLSYRQLQSSPARFWHIFKDGLRRFMDADLMDWIAADELDLDRQLVSARHRFYR